MARRDANFIIELAVVVGTQADQCMRIVEWGSGRSTLHLPCLVWRELGRDVEWLTIEYNRSYWLNEVAPWIDGFVERQFLPRGATVERFRPDTGLDISALVLDYGELAPFEPDRQRDRDVCMVDYEDAANNFLGRAEVDFVIVDGRKRARILAQSSESLSRYGVAVLHDAQREAYWPGFEAFQSGGFVAPMLWVGGNMAEADLLRMISFAWERVDINDA